MKHMRWRAIATVELTSCALLVVSAGFAQTAAPTRAGTRLVYQRTPGADSCPDEVAFREAVAAQTSNGADPFTAAGPSTLRVTLAPGPPGSGFQATMELFDATGKSAGTDTKQAPTCAAAARSLAFSASVVFLTAPVPTGTPVTTAAPLATAPPVPPPAPPTKLPPAVRVEIGAGALVGFGFAPNPSAGFGGFVGLRFPRALPAFGLMLEGRGDLDVSGDAVVLAKASAQPRTGFAGGSIAPCGYLRWFFGCGLFTIGAVHGTAGPAYEPAGQESLFAGLGGRIGGEVWIVDGPPSFGVRLSLDGLFALSRPAVIADGEQVWISPLGAGAASLHLVALL